MKEKLVVITGTSKGIGKAISLKLLEDGYHIVGISRSHSLIHPRFHGVTLDLSDIRQLPEALKKLIKLYPETEAVICNAGQGLFGHLEELSYEQIYATISLNLMSHVYLIKSFLPLLKKQKKGNIIFIGSESALEGKRKGSVYCASKFAIRGFAQALREECSTSGVSVSLINPGMVMTDFFNQLSFRPGAEPTEHILPEDIAELVLFLLRHRLGTVFDEINLSPQKKRILFS